MGVRLGAFLLGWRGRYGDGVKQWTDFFVAAAGAGAALGGLMIVAVSVNVAEIIKYPQLPARAGATIASLMLVVVVALLALAPQPLIVLGWEVTVVAAAAWVLHLRSAAVVVRGNRAGNRPVGEAVEVIAVSQAQVLPLLVGGVLLGCSVAAGEYVVFAAIIAVLPLAVLEAWVLLVEILR